MKSANDRFDITIPTTDDPGHVGANPFTDKFLEEEVAFYDLPKAYSKNGVEVQLVKPRGRLDDYLNKNFRVGRFEVPVLSVDGNLWMSLTHMEIQSMYVPISMCGGVVGTAGLGLGYFALRAASLGRVDRVDVFEVESRVVDFFLEAFDGRPEMRKINIGVGDAREEMLEKDYDLVFMDIYQTLLGDDVIADAEAFVRNGRTGTYRFWGQERVLLDALVERDRNRPHPSELEGAYFRAWQRTQEPLDPRNPKGEKFKLSELYEPATDRAFRTKVFRALGLI